MIFDHDGQASARGSGGGPPEPNWFDTARDLRYKG
jgi:hypothetical protein